VTEYRIAPGEITRTDRYTPVMPLDAERITMEFASFSDDASNSGDSIAFAKGDVTHFAATGIGECRSERAAGKSPYRSPNGPFTTRVVCTTGKTRLDKPFSIAWAIRYR
jgi:hypothetical protein